MNQKGFVNIVLIVLVIVLIGVAGYFVLSNRLTAPELTPPVDKRSTIPTITNDTPTSWEFVDANFFTLSLPPGWKFNKLQGIDSYVGEFVGDDTKLHFDFGWYSNSLTEDGDPNHIVTYEIIDGYRAKIVVPKVTGNGITGVYFDKLGDEGPQQTGFNLYGENFTSFRQETALKIFRTLKIVKQMWP